jgi:heterogeneous nuclear ribonucleoprotein F/H
MGGNRYVKARGLPWSATPRDVVNFFDTSNIIGGHSGVHFVINMDGRATGQCYVEMESQEDVEAALAKHKEKIGARYIEVFTATEFEFDRDMNKGRDRSMTGGGVGSRMGASMMGAGMGGGMMGVGGNMMGGGGNMMGGGNGMMGGGSNMMGGGGNMMGVGGNMMGGGGNMMGGGGSMMGVGGGMMGGGANMMMGSGGNMMGGGGSMMGGGGGMMGSGGGMMGGGGGMMGSGGGMMGSMMNSMMSRGDSMMSRGDSMMGGGGGMMGGGYGNGCENTDDAVVKLRGLPFTATKADITDFFTGIDIESNGILIVTDFNGRPKGEAFVQFTTEAGAKKALRRNKENMGHRYIEVFTSSMDEARRAQEQVAPGRDMGGPGPMRSGPGMRPGPYDRNGSGGMGARAGSGFGGMRGSGFGDYPDDFATGMGAGMGGPMGGSMGGPMGGGMGAGMGGMGAGMPAMGGGMRGGMGADMVGMGGMGGGAGGYGMRGGRFPIKVGFRLNATLYNFLTVLSLFCSRYCPTNIIFLIQMRGLPFRVTEQDISEWFSSVADPIDIYIMLNEDNRPSGEAEVTFATEGDAKRAMQKNKQNMQHRYIELFAMY